VCEYDDSDDADLEEERRKEEGITYISNDADLGRMTRGGRGEGKGE